MSRRSERWNPEGVGCKGGTSATAGKKSCLYDVVFPDGTSKQVRTFKAQGQLAHAVIYLGQDGQWYSNGVYDELPVWARDGKRTVTQTNRLA